MMKKAYLTIAFSLLVPLAFVVYAQVGAFPNGGTAPFGSGGGITNLATAVGNLPVTNLNSGTGASASTFWRGNGTWGAPTVANLDLSAGLTNVTAPGVAGWLTITNNVGGGTGTLFLGPNSSTGIELNKGTDADGTFATGTLEVTNGAQNFVTNVSALGFRTSTNGGLYLGTTATRPAIVGRLPTSLTGFGTSPTLPTATGGGSLSFLVNVGTGGTATGGTVNFVASDTGWNCRTENLTANAANRANQRVVQMSSTTTTVVIQNQLVSTGAAQAFTASDVLLMQCTAY